jgi:hypothetical protein
MDHSQLKENEFLTKISWYELGRKEGYVRIMVHEILLKNGLHFDSKFIAIPMGYEGNGLKKKFHGNGSTEKEALSDCLNKLRNVPSDELSMSPLLQT